MKTFKFIALFLVLGNFPIAFSDEPCCEEGQDLHPQKKRVELFYSSDDNIRDPLNEPQDPRQDFEWPGQNESSFYESLTR